MQLIICILRNYNIDLKSFFLNSILYIYDFINNILYNTITSTFASFTSKISLNNIPLNKYQRTPILNLQKQLK